MAPLVEPASAVSNLAVRAGSAAVLIPLVLGAIYLGHPWFDVLVIAFAGIMAWEWSRIAGRHRDPSDPNPETWLAASGISPAGSAVIAIVLAALIADRFPLLRPAGLSSSWVLVSAGAVLATLIAFPSQGRRALWFGAGVVYVAVPAIATLWLRDDPLTGKGVETLAWILALVICTDTGAYAVGRSFGGPKLAPRISPNKTWSGLMGGVAAAAMAGLAAALWLDLTSVWKIMILSGALAVVEQGGDLLESAFKRRFGMKDSSHIIPGHGGVLDRVDGLLAVSVAVAILDYFGKGSVLAWL